MTVVVPVVVVVGGPGAGKMEQAYLPAVAPAPAKMEKQVYHLLVPRPPCQVVVHGHYLNPLICKMQKIIRPKNIQQKPLFYFVI